MLSTTHAGALRLSVAVAATLVAAASAHAQNLIVSSTDYVDPNFGVGTTLPNNSKVIKTTTSSAFCSGSATDCSTNVWSGASADGNFGTTSAIVLSQVNATTGATSYSLNLTSLAAANNINLVTSFASKSELALNATPDGNGITLMGYNTTVGQLDISNTDTPGVIEPGNTDTASPTYRGVAQLNLTNNALQYTTTNAYNGNNGRAALLASNGYYYMAGNGGNGNGSNDTTAGTGLQLLTPGVNATAATPGTTQVGSYNITQNGYQADKSAKDNNFRGLTTFNNNIYFTKGSGSNGINTVYTVTPNTGAGATSSGGIATSGGTISVLPGFSLTLAKATATAANPVYHPFGLFFADVNTLYVADEGSGNASDFSTTPYELGGLQKWVFVNNTWTLAYTLRGSLMGASYTVQGTGGLSGYSLTTTTDGLRNITGKVNGDGTVTLYAVTSTAGSKLGDAGADPNKLVAITDTIGYTTAAQASGEDYTTLQTAALGSALRGVAFSQSGIVPVPGSVWLLGSGVLGLIGVSRRRRTGA